MWERYEKEMLCPKCGKKMSLVAAGYYCLKDDYVIDPLTGKPPVKSEFSAYLIEDRKRVNVSIDENQIIFRDFSSRILYSIPVGDIEELEVGESKLSAADAVAMLQTGVFALPKNIGPTLKVTYTTKTRVKNSVTLVSGNASELARKIDSVRSVKIGTVSSLSTNVPNASALEKKFCRYCGAQNHDDAVFCEKCGRKIG